VRHPCCVDQSTVR